MFRHPVLLDRKRCGLLIVDIQEKLLPVMAAPDRVVENSVKLIEGFQILDAPVFVTEQYPKGIGPTAAPVKQVLGKTQIREKTTFSCCGIPDLVQTMRRKKIDQVVVCGIESHVCVWQTTMDLLHAGVSAYVVRDAVSSRNPEDMDTAIKRMQSSGAHVTTTEMVLFELLERAGTEEFKKIMKRIK